MTKADFIENLRSCNRAPFLFLGSGFSHHYINTPTWKDLLSKFAPDPINKYTSILNTISYPEVASKIAEELTIEFWKKSDTDDFKKRYEKDINDRSSLLKILISEFLCDLSSKGIPKKYEDEVTLLQSLPIDGIITTNWDNTAELLFPNYKTYIGQSQLITSSSYGIGEIYKIHGCVSSPQTMVVTKEDYDNYNKRNAYLAAKLITIFLEHPIIIMGYSLSDTNIIDILCTIVDCLGNDTIKMLQDRLVVVDWQKEDAKTSIEETSLVMNNGRQLPITRFATSDYKEVYDCLKYYRRKISTNLLRKYKEHFYNIVISENPEQSLYVLPDTDIDGNKKVEFVCGFGAINSYSSKGYSSITILDICRDIVHDNANFDARKLLSNSLLPKMKSKNPPYYPIYKYLRAIGITTGSFYEEKKGGIKIKLRKKFQAYPSVSDADKLCDLQTIINKYKNNPIKAIQAIPYLNVEEKELLSLSQFIDNTLLTFLNSKKYGTQMKALVCFYDWKKYGW